MARTISIGAQGFEDIRTNGYFYVDKTGFIYDWWHGGDVVTLICRPRRFGKTLMLDTVRCFLSPEFAGRGEELFGDLTVWEREAVAGQKSMSTVPVIMISFADCKGANLSEAIALIQAELADAVHAHDYLLASEFVLPSDRRFLQQVCVGMDMATTKTCLKRLSSALLSHWGSRPVILLDEYDTPLQEAWHEDYWDEMSNLVRGIFNASFKTNRYLARGLITGITRVAQESIFSDMNNPAVVTTTVPAYQTAFGFTRDEVLDALDEYGLTHMSDDVESWYDGFTFGDVNGVFNPWSITNLLKTGEIRTYWANTSSNTLVGDLVRDDDEGDLYEAFQVLLAGGSVIRSVDETIEFRTLGKDPNTAWSLLLAAGYVRSVERSTKPGSNRIELRLTNREVRSCFDSMVRGWFSTRGRSYNAFVEALLLGDIPRVNATLQDVARFCMSSFDSATHPSPAARLERFWHGLTLGLVVDLRDVYDIRSNEEAGTGRCDLLLAPNPQAEPDAPAIILEFKAIDQSAGEGSLEDAVASAREQIRQRGYDSALLSRGIRPERIFSYGVAFRGTQVLVG